MLQDDDPVQKALREAESAASKAQRALKEVHKLPSARVRGQVGSLG